MSATNTGGPAFPQPDHTSQNSATGETTQYQWFSDGMTLRDYFAAKALPWTMENCSSDPANGRTWQQEAARVAYEMAFAMLEERES